MTDVATDALKAALVGDHVGAFVILTDHIRQAENPSQAMFVLACGYAAVCQDEDMTGLPGLPAEDADVLRTLVTAVRSDDLVGAWLLWCQVSAGVCGSVLGGLLALAAVSARREAGL